MISICQGALMSSVTLSYKPFSKNQACWSDSSDNAACQHVQEEHFVVVSAAISRKQRILNPLLPPSDGLFSDLEAHVCLDCARTVTIPSLPKGA